MRCVTKRGKDLLVSEVVRPFHGLKAFVSRQRPNHRAHIYPCTG